MRTSRMELYVYWNTIDKDCKKIFHCLSPNDEETIIPIFDADCIDRKVKPFKKDEVVRRIKDANTVIFCTHGGPDEIMKCRQREKKDCDNFILIDKNNIQLLKDKIVIALCCYSAKRLGPNSLVGADKCKAYIGFKTPIYYDDEERKKAGKTRHVIYVAYKKAIKKTLIYAQKNNVDVKEFRERLDIYLQQELVGNILEQDDGSMNNKFMTTIEGLVALGDVNAKVFY